MIENILEIILSWFLAHGIRIIAIAVGGFIVYWISKIFVRRSAEAVAERITAERNHKMGGKRAKTLSKVILNTLKAVIFLIVLLMILSELGVNIGPILAGAGVIGLAVGFGAQSLVKDVISGLFILIEDQYREGDLIEIAGKRGRVKEVTLRKTVLEDEEDGEHHITHSQIKAVSNLRKSKKS